MRGDDIAAHAYAVATSGFTVLRAQVDAERLDTLRGETDRALAAVRRHLERGGSLAATAATPWYLAARCLYRWGAASAALLDHAAVHALAAELLGPPRLWDLSALAALPAGDDDAAVTTAWHRDHDARPAGAPPDHLWCFLCLDDATADNGATWCVPGSHRPARAEPPLPEVWTDDSSAAFPSRMQLIAGAGDIVVVDATMLHASGRNRTARPRRLLNLGLRRAGVPPLVDHRAIAGEALLASLGPRARALIGGRDQRAPATWDVLPEPPSAPSSARSAGGSRARVSARR